MEPHPLTIFHTILSRLSILKTTMDPCEPCLKIAKTVTDNAAMKTPLIAECVLSFTTGEYAFVGTVCKSWRDNYGTHPEYCNDIDEFSLDPPFPVKHTLPSMVNSESRIQEVIDLVGDEVDDVGNIVNETMMTFLEEVMLHRIKIDDLAGCNFILENKRKEILRSRCTPNAFYFCKQSIEYGAIDVMKDFVRNGVFERYMITPQYVGKYHHSKSKEMMEWLVSQGFNLSYSYTEAIRKRSVKNMQLLKDIGVEYPDQMWKQGLTFGHSDLNILKWISKNCYGGEMDHMWSIVF